MGSLSCRWAVGAPEGEEEGLERMTFVNTTAITNRQNSTFFARISVSCISSRVHKPHSAMSTRQKPILCYILRAHQVVISPREGDSGQVIAGGVPVEFPLVRAESVSPQQKWIGNRRGLSGPNG